MAIATTLFVATDDDLARLFPAVRLPGAEPITRVGRNPFGIMAGQTWDSAKSDPPRQVTSIYDDDDRPLLAPVAALPAGTADLEALERLSPQRLRMLPHFATTEMTGFALDALTKVLTGESRPPARFVDALEGDGFIDGLASETLEPLVALTDDDMNRVCKEWAASLAGRGGTPSLWLLTSLRALAREAIARKGNVFTHITM